MVSIPLRMGLTSAVHLLRPALAEQRLLFGARAAQPLPPGATVFRPDLLELRFEDRLGRAVIPPRKRGEIEWKFLK
jgi:hypothetical protein